MMSSHNTRPSTGVKLAGDAAKELGVGIQTLHYYEREGLIPAPERAPAGYRLYTAATIQRVAFIKKAQALGLPLADIRDVLRLADEGGCPCGHVQRALAERLREADERLLELQSYRDERAVLVARAPTLQRRGSRTRTRVCAIVDAAPARGSAPVGRQPRRGAGARRR